MHNDEFLSTRKLVLLALLTAIVIILQLIGTFIRFGPFSVSLVLMPIVVGAALIGIAAGFWLGLVFGLVVLVSGDASIFLAINPIATLVIVTLKGIFAGVCAAIAYKYLSRINKIVGALSAAIVCPVVNTGVFACGMLFFFRETLNEWSMAESFIDAVTFLFVGMIGFNAVFEMGLNVILCPVIIRLIDYGRALESKQ